MNVHYAQYREMKGIEVMRVCYIFLAVLNGRASQTRFKSEQSIPAAPGMLVYFIYFCPYYTHKYYKQYGIDSEPLLANKEFNLG